MKECLNCGYNMKDSVNVCPICKTKAKEGESDRVKQNIDAFVFVCPKHHKQYDNFRDTTPVPGWRCTCGKGLSFSAYVGTAYPKPIYRKPNFAVIDPLAGKTIADLDDNIKVVIGKNNFKYKSDHKMYNTLSHQLFSIIKDGDNGECRLNILTNHSGIMVNNRIAAYNSEVKVKNGDRILINNFLYLTISEVNKV